MIKFVKILFAVILLWLVGSCTADPEWDTGDDRPDPGKEGVTLNLEIYGPASFSAPAAETRAMDFQSENRIDNIYVLVFNANDRLSAIMPASTLTSSPNPAYTPGAQFSASGVFTVQNLLPAISAKMTVLANAATILGNTIGINNTSSYIGETYDTVIAALSEAITNSMYPGAATANRIPMWGETPRMTISQETGLVPVSLMRAIARVDVGLGSPMFSTSTMSYTWSGLAANGSAIPFRINSVYVVHPNNRYALVPAVVNRNATSGEITAPTIPAGTSTIPLNNPPTTFTYTAPSGYSTQSIYIPEADIIMGGTGTPGDVNHANRMAIVVGGYFNGSPTETFYRLDFARNGALINVLRNHLYQFSIAGVSGTGSSSVVNAYTSVTMNMRVNVLAWNETDMGNIVFNGDSYFSVNPTQLHFTPANNQTATATIRTNIPNFSMSLGGVTRLQAGGAMPATYIDSATGLIYTLSNGATSDTYNLAVSTLLPNTGAQNIRVNNWTFVAGRLNMPFTVDQAWANPYISVANGSTTNTGPEGTNNNPANNLPLNVSSSNPINVSVIYGPQGSPTDWVHGIVQNPPLVNGSYTSNMNLSVDPFVYGPGNTVDRTATIIVTPQNGAAAVYTIRQQAPYITLLPPTTTIPRPAAPTTVDTPVTVMTNIPVTDLVTPPTGTSNDVGLTYMSAVMPYTLTSDVNSRNRQFIIRTNMSQQAINYTGTISSTFTVTPNSTKYGTLPTNSNSSTVTVGPSASTLNTYINQVDFSQSPGAYAWKTAARYTDQATNMIVPWNTTKVDVDVVSNMRPVPDPTMGTTVQPMTPATVDRGNGLTAYAYEYTLPTTTSYSLGNTHSLRFNSTYPAGTSSTLRFQQGAQYITRDGPTQAVLLGHTGTTGVPLAQTSLNIRSNVNWTTAIGSWVPDIGAVGQWITTSVDGSAYTVAPLTFEDRQSSVVYTTSYYEGRDLLAPQHTLYFSVAPITTLNAGTFTNGARTATITFTNNNFDNAAYGRRGAANPLPIQIIQFAPELRNANSTLPTNTDRIPYNAASYAFVARTNLQGWGMRVYEGPYSPDKTPVVQQDFASQNSGTTINAAGLPQNYATTVNIPANTSSTATKVLYFYQYASEFPNMDPALLLVGVRVQDYMPPNAPPVNGGGGADFIYFDASNRYRIGNIMDGSITASTQTSSGTGFTSNLALFKFGSIIGFDGNGVFGGQVGVMTGTIKFDPTNRAISRYQDILAFNNTTSPAPPSTAPGTYIGDPGYNTYYNLMEFGLGDPCRLIGYNDAEVRAWTEDQWQAAMNASQWRIATAMENAYFIGGSGATSFDPTRPPTNWTRGTQFNNTWTSIYGYGYQQGTTSNLYNFEVPNQTPARIAVPVVPGGQPLSSPMRVTGNSIRYAPTGQLGLDNPLEVNFWSGTVAYNSTDTGQLGYGVVRVPGGNHYLYPSYQRQVNFGMPVRCVRR